MPTLHDRVLGRLLAWKSIPCAATSAMAIAIEVSSVHSPDALGHCVFMTALPRPHRRLELVGRPEGVTRRGPQQDTLHPILI